MGFPAIVPSTLCFFSVTISARQEERHTYLIDGVAIHGVSGGPVVYSNVAKGVQIVGTVSAYVGGSTTPGLLFARDVSHFHTTVSRIRTIDEANRQKKLQQAQQHPSTPPQQPPSATPGPSEPPAKSG